MMLADSVHQPDDYGRDEPDPGANQRAAGHAIVLSLHKSGPTRLAMALILPDLGYGMTMVVLLWILLAVVAVFMVIGPILARRAGKKLRARRLND